MKLQSLATSLACLLSLATLSGCTMVRYVTQASVGQDDLAKRAVDIKTLLDGNHVEGRTRLLLSEVGMLKEFAEEHGLAATPNYTDYVRLDRPVVAWNVSACAPLAFRPKTWGFPIVGNFTALNWFNKLDADEFAADLVKGGWDVDLRGLSAYSTAGWFTDPIVSSMLSSGPEARGRLANTVLHESTHATFFVPGQSALNESVANFVGDHLSVVYMEERIGKDSRETRAYLESERRGDLRVKALHDAYVALAALYASKSPREEKLQKKAEILQKLHDEQHFTRPINNATIISYRTYNSGQEELGALLSACSGSYPRFFATLAKLKEMSHAEGQSFAVGDMVRAVSGEGCVAP